MRLRNPWRNGEKEKMVAHYRKAKASDSKMTLAKFAEAYCPDRTAKTLGQVIYELNKKAKDNAKAAGTNPTTTITQAPAKASSNWPKKRATADISSDDSDSDSSSDECIEDITFPGMRTPNKRIKLVYTTRSQTWLNNPETPQDSDTTQPQASEVLQRLDKATPMLSPRLRRGTTTATPTEHASPNNPDPQSNASSMSDSQRDDDDTVPPPPPSKSRSPPPPPPSDPPPAVSTLPSPYSLSISTAPPIEEPQKEQIQNHNDKITAATAGNIDDQKQPEPEATEDSAPKPEEATTTVAHIRKVIAQQLADFHRTNEQFKQANRKQYAEFSQTSELLLALNQRSEKENSHLKSELAVLQERYEAMKTEKDGQIAQLQAKIESWEPERERLLSENATLEARLEGVQKALRS